MIRQCSRSALAVAVLMLSACAPLVIFGAGTAAGVAGYKYYDGSLTVVYDAPFMDTWKASVRAVEEMRLDVADSDHDLTKGKIKAVRSDGKKIRISVEYKSNRQTEVVIRVGILGDQKASMAIKEKIRRILVSR